MRDLGWAAPGRVSDDHAGRGGGRGQARLTGQPAGARVAEAALERARWPELLVAREHVDGAAAAHALAAARLSERQADVADRVEQGGLVGRAELGHGQAQRPAAGPEDDLGHMRWYAASRGVCCGYEKPIKKPKGQLPEKLALRTQ